MLQTKHFPIGYTGTKAEIEALSPVATNSRAVTTDTDESGFYDGAAWVWSKAPVITSFANTTGILPAANGGTGKDNGAVILTIAETMSAAGRNVANTFTVKQTITPTSTTQLVGAVLEGTATLAGDASVQSGIKETIVLNPTTLTVASNFRAIDLIVGTANNAFNYTSSQIRAVNLLAYHAGSTKITGLITGGYFDVQNTGAGGASALSGNVALIRSTGAGTVDSAKGFEVLNPIVSAGAITTMYGLYINNLTTAGTNYSIYTGTAAAGVRFGSRVQIIGSADAIQLRVLAHSTNTALLASWETSASAVVNSMSLTMGAVFNEQGDAAIDHRIESDTESNMFFLDSSTDALYLGGTTNGVKILKGGEFSLLGTATTWEDLRIEPVSRSSGAKAPSFISWQGGLYLFDFNDAAAASEKEIFFTVQLPHAWKEGSAVEPHVHWVNKTTGTAGHVVRWGIEYTKVSIGGTFGAPTTVYATTIAGGGDITVANEHMLTDFASIDMTGDTISTILVCRLFRNSSNAADTYTGTAGLLYIDWHYEIDSLGSKTELAK